MRIGHGYDVHKLVEGRPLILGGVTIPFEKGLLGHSDADVLLHAISDALLGAAAEERTTLYGAVLCPGAAARAGAVLNEGALLADRAEAGEDAILLERVAVWPGRRVPAGARLTASLTAGGLKPPLAFGGGGTLEGAIGAELTAETLLVLGGLLGREGTVGLGWAGGAGARMLAQAAGTSGTR